MVIVEPYPNWYPNTHPWWAPDPQIPYVPYPTDVGTYTVERTKEIEKKWRERHIKNVKRGILITFDDSENPIFIATDDACFQKILEAIKDEGHKDNKGD